MICGVCDTDLEGCVCPDLTERMREVCSIPGSRVTCRWCARCDQHYARCKCSEPVWRLLWDGELIDHPRLAEFNA